MFFEKGLIEGLMFGYMSEKLFSEKEAGKHDVKIGAEL